MLIFLPFVFSLVFYTQPSFIFRPFIFPSILCPSTFSDFCPMMFFRLSSTFTVLRFLNFSSLSRVFTLFFLVDISRVIFWALFLYVMPSHPPSPLPPLPSSFVSPFPERLLPVSASWKRPCRHRNACWNAWLLPPACTLTTPSYHLAKPTIIATFPITKTVA